MAYANRTSVGPPIGGAFVTKQDSRSSKRLFNAPYVTHETSWTLWNSMTPNQSWDDYFLRIATVVATRSSCLRRKVGAVIAKDKRIISTGYNGTPRGVTNCNQGGCPRCKALDEWSLAKPPEAEDLSGVDLGECFCSHAEENTIVQAAYHGISTKGGCLYTTLSPCLMCAKMAINAGLVLVVFSHLYPASTPALRMLKEAQVQVRNV